jgi:hypothetical protein
MPSLVAEIKEIKPNIIVLMGKVAWETPRFEGIDYLETYHPAAAMRFPKIRKKFEKDIQKLTPDYIDFILLKPPETYILKAISEGQDLQSLYASSFLGKKAAKKTIFALFCLGILGTHPMTTPNKPLQEFSAAELRKILDTFNAKCSYIYKYISKKLGPVALNLLEKSIEDTKPNLSPPFQNVSLGADGKIDLQSVVKSNVILSDLEARQMFIKSLNEILTAEILAVKKTLGKDLESSLIKNLEKIGA